MYLPVSKDGETVGNIDADNPVNTHGIHGRWRE